MGDESHEARIHMESNTEGIWFGREIKFYKKDKPDNDPVSVWSTKSWAIISIDSELLQKSPETSQFLLKHAISRVQSEDFQKNRCFKLTVDVSSSIFGALYLPFFPAVGLSFLASWIADRIVEGYVLTYQEERADYFAIKNSSDSELEAALKFFKNNPAISKNSCLHMRRIQRIEQALQERKES